MITLEEIKEKSLWSVNLEDGTLSVGTSDKIEKYAHTGNKLSLLKASMQPTELQPFWLAYEYAINELKRDDLIEVDDFYRAWSKDPDEFDPEMKSRFTLRSFFLLHDHYPASTIVSIVSSNGLHLGSHSRTAFEKALNEIGSDTDFNVVNYYEETDYNTHTLKLKIVIKGNNNDKLQEFAALANRFDAEELFG